MKTIKIYILKKGKAFFFASFLILICFYSFGQSKWRAGVYFIPAKFKYHFTQQQTNINMISGVTVSRTLSERVSLTSGIFYFRNHLKGDTNSCYYCAANTVKTEIFNQFLESMIGSRIAISKKPLKFKPYFISGIIVNAEITYKEIDENPFGEKTTFTERKFLFHDIYYYYGLGLEYKFNDNTFFLIEPTLRGTFSYFTNRNSLISYYSMFGIGLSVNIFI